MHERGPIGRRMIIFLAVEVAAAIAAELLREEGRAKADILFQKSKNFLRNKREPK